MSYAVRSDISSSPVQRLAGDALPVATVVAGVAGGDTHAIVQLVRYAARRSELAARRCAAGARPGMGLVVIVLLGLFLSALELMSKQTCGGGSKVDVARLKLEKYAFEAYPSWAAEHPDRMCPRSLHELDAYMNTDDDHDSWGTPIELRCDPTGAKGVWLRSAGEDARFGTEDDLVSSE
jgi:hypothetical protein